MLLVLSGTLQYHGIDADNSSLTQFDTLVQAAINAPASYSDLSDYDIVFSVTVYSETIRILPPSPALSVP